MKLANQREVSEYKQHILMGGIRGAALGGCVSATLWQFWLRKKPFMTSGFVKTLTLATPVLLFGVTNMEIVGRDFEMLHNYYEDEEASARLVKPEEHTLLTWAKENQYKLVAGGWAASMVGSYWIVNRDKYMTKSQKIVQARVYAQGLTVIMLLATVFLSAGKKETTRVITPSQQADSWKGDLKFVEEHKE